MQINLDHIEVPKEELQKVISSSMVSVRKEYHKKKVRRIARWCSAAAAAIAVAAVVCISNPTLAAELPLIGHIFERVQDDQQYPGDYSSKADRLAGTTVSESQGVTVTLSEIVCTDQSMNVSVMIESEEAFPERALQMSQTFGEDYGTRLFLTAEHQVDFMDHTAGADEYGDLEVKGEFEDDHTFIGAFRINFEVYPFAEYEVPDSFNWEMKVSGISYFAEEGGAREALADGGEWTFSNEIQKSEPETKTVSVNQYEPNGNGISEIVMTPYEVTINYVYDESQVQPGYESFDSIHSVMLDGSGKLIDDKVGMFPAEGYDLSKITVYSLDVSNASEAEWEEMWEKLYDESFAAQLPGWLEERSAAKMEIDLAE